MNRSKIIQAYEARHTRPAKVKAEELPTPPKYVFVNEDCDAFNAIRVFDAELRNKIKPKLSDWIDAREAVYQSLSTATTEYIDDCLYTMDFEDGSKLLVDMRNKFFRVLNWA